MYSSVSREYAEKKTSAMNSMASTFTMFLQKNMKELGFNEKECYMFHPLFLHFMNSLLLYASEKLLASNLNHSIRRRDEILRLNERLESNDDPTFGPDINIIKATNLINIKFQIYLKNLMHEANFDEMSCKEDHEIFQMFLNEAFTTLCEIYFLYQSEASDASKMDLGFPSSFEKRFEPSSITLISTTEKYKIYSVVIPTGKCTLKVIRTSAHGKIALAEFVNEIKVSKLVSHPALRSAIEATNFEGKSALLLEYASGDTFCKINFSKEKFILQFLQIAREIVSGLLTLHRNELMHLNLSCRHILVDLQKRTTKIICFGTAAPFSSKVKHHSIEELITKDLKFISPEQTGRTNQDIDFRCDFYSLGIVFYRVLTGKFPFESDDTLNLIHMHVSKEAQKVHEINNDIPIPISEMISKLINKKKEDRYQSAKGIMYDIELMISEYEKDNTLSSITLAQHDRLTSIIIPQKNYGRTTELQELRSEILSMNKDYFKLILISGEPGSGKSFLAMELYTSVIEREGFMLCGKYDKTKQQPHSALLEAAQGFCECLLLKDKETLNQYKSSILESIGEEGGILTKIISNLEQILGKQPPISDAYGNEAKLRFNYVLFKFFKAICSVGKPIVLLLDDMQWADMDSINFLSVLAADKSIGNMLLLGTCRKSEVHKKHQLMSLLDVAKKANLPIIPVDLKNLNHDDVNNFISDALSMSPLDTYSLTALIYSKTNGLPFFVSQMLESLSEQNIISFCNERGKWKWDTMVYGKDKVAGDVVELLRQKLMTYDKYTQQAIKVASCLGSPFDIAALNIVVNNRHGVHNAISTGMIVQYKGRKTEYRFSHDTIQQAAYSLLPQNPETLFSYIGKKLWKLLPCDVLDRNIFVIVNLMKQQLKRHMSDEETLDLAKLFIKAGERALSSTAFKVAFSLFDSAINLLQSDCWKNHYDLTLKLFDLSSQAAFCCGNKERLNSLLYDISINAKSALHLVHSKRIQIQAFSYKLQYEDAIKAGVNALREIGEDIDFNCSKARIGLEMERVKEVFNKRTDYEILSMPTMQNEVSHSKILIYRDILSSSFYFNPRLFAFVSSRMIQITFEFGFSEFSSSGFCAFGTVLSGLREKLSYRVGRLGLALLEKANSNKGVPYNYIMFYSFISPFYSSIHDSLRPSSKHSSLCPLLVSYRVGFEKGLLEGAFLSAEYYVQYSFFVGKNLFETIEDIKGLKFSKNNPLILSIHQAIFNLIHDCPRPGQLSGSIFKYDAIGNDTRDFFLVRIYLVSCILAYIFNDFVLASSFMKRYKTLNRLVLTQYHYPLGIFYEGLITAAMAKQSKDKFKSIEKINKSIKNLQNFADNSKDYLNKIELIKTELVSLNGEKSTLEIVALYDNAISLSRKYNFLIEEALTNECAGTYCLAQNDEARASKYFHQALDCYETWGAETKVKSLTSRFPSFFSKKRKIESDYYETKEVELSTDMLSTVSDITPATALSLKSQCLI